MIYIVMILFGTFSLVWGYRIKVKRELDLIPKMDEDLLKRVRRKNKVAEDFGLSLFLITATCYLTAILTFFFGKFGTIGGVVFVIIAALRWATLQNVIEEKINKKIY